MAEVPTNISELPGIGFSPLLLINKEKPNPIDPVYLSSISYISTSTSSRTWGRKVRISKQYQIIGVFRKNQSIAENNYIEQRKRTTTSTREEYSMSVSSSIAHSGSGSNNSMSMMGTSYYGTSGSGSGGSSHQRMEALLDDIRMEEGDLVDLPMVSFSQIQVHEIVTEGSFKYYHGHTKDEDDVESEVPNYVALKCLRGSDPNQYYRRALKWIQETKLLANLKHHDHIRNIHAQSIVSLADSLENHLNHEIGISDRYFLVVDPIQETLARRIDEWRSFEGGSSRRKRNSLLASPTTTVTNIGRRNAVNTINKYDALGRVKFVAQDVIKAMTYLHSNHITFGDLTPDKIGFNHRGVLKLIDFSGASSTTLGENNNNNNNDDDEDSLFAEDMYSFGLLLWELFTLKTPKERRPILRGVVHAEPLRDFLGLCWSKDLSKRPKFSKRLGKRMMEITSTCRHNLVVANHQRELGEIYHHDHHSSSPQAGTMRKSSSMSSMRRGNRRSLRSPNMMRNPQKAFRVSKVDLTFDVFSKQLESSCWDLGTVSTSNSELSSSPNNE
eukprot:scaffold6231_cov108-Cylindrotheca_fusiformis.AAC.2